LNPSENIQTTSNINYVRIPIVKAGNHPVSVSTRSNKQELSDYKHIDHQRTKALTEVFQQRTQQRLFH
jgi:hypothetical protein